MCVCGCGCGCVCVCVFNDLKIYLTTLKIFLDIDELRMELVPCLTLGPVE